MTKIIPLPVHPYPLSEALSASLRAAKSEMAVDYQVLPVRPSDGRTDRILSMSSPDDPPAWIRDYIVVDPDDIEAVKTGIEWTLDNWMDHPNAVYVTDILKKIYGDEIVEVEDE